MKILKISANYQMIPQNPSGQADPKISLQNMQNAQEALGEIDKIIEAANDVNTALSKLDDILGNETGLKQQASNKILEVLSKNPAVNLLMQMNLIPNPQSLFNAGDLDRVKIKITSDISHMQSEQQSQSTNPPKNPK
jgi:hypothetical protein